jgi:vacuolar iron transporter family protein
MNHSVKKGLSFGLTSGVITTLGLLVGLSSGTGSKIVIIGGIMVIAIADAMSDALGIHISEEAENDHTHREVWQSTIATFVSKFIIALTFLMPIILLELNLAVIINIVWGLLLIAIISYYLAKQQKVEPWPIILEHVLITVAVVVITYYIGSWVATLG